MSDFIDDKITEEVRAGRLSEERAHALMRTCLALPPEQRAELARILSQHPQFFPIFVENLEKKLLAVASDDMSAWRAIIEEEVRQIDTIS